VWLWDCSLEGNIGGGDGDFECLAVLNGHEGDVKSVVFAQSHGQFGDGDEIVVSGSYDNTVRVWAEDAGDWYCAVVLTEAHTLWSLALSPGATRLVSGSANASIGIYKCYTAQERKTIAEETAVQQEGTPNQGFWKCVGRLPQAHHSEVLSVAYAPAKAGHGRFASCGDSLQIYREALESTSDHPLFALEASSPRMNLNCVQWHPRDGSLLATAGDDGRVRVWKYGKTPNVGLPKR
jgi:WD40 repeat protein